MLAELEKKTPADIEVVTLDIKRKKGGEYLKLPQCVLSGRKKGEKPVTNASTSSKNPSHHDNFTRNVLVKGTNPRKLHVYLIKKFNGMEVLP